MKPIYLKKLLTALIFCMISISVGATQIFAAVR